MPDTSSGWVTLHPGWALDLERATERRLSSASGCGGSPTARSSPSFQRHDMCSTLSFFFTFGRQSSPRHVLSAVPPPRRESRPHPRPPRACVEAGPQFELGAALEIVGSPLRHQTNANRSRSLVVFFLRTSVACPAVCRPGQPLQPPPSHGA